LNRKIREFCSVFLSFSTFVRTKKRPFVRTFFALFPETARTRLILEIGNGTDTIMLPAMELPYLAKHYCIKLSRSRMAFQLIDTKFGTNLSWTNGVHLTNASLEMSVPLPPRIFVPFWKVTKLRCLLQVPHFAAIRILSESNNRYLDVLVLRKMQDLLATPSMAPLVPVYPVLPILSFTAYFRARNRPFVRPARFSCRVCANSTRSLRELASKNPRT